MLNVIQKIRRPRKARYPLPPPPPVFTDVLRAIVDTLHTYGFHASDAAALAEVRYQNVLTALRAHTPVSTTDTQLLRGWTTVASMMRRPVSYRTAMAGLAPATDSSPYREEAASGIAPT